MRINGDHEDMGRITIEVGLANFIEVARAEQGAIPMSEVRRARLPAVVDTGATYLVIPERVAKELGLHIHGEISVRYADQRTAVRPLASGVWLELMGREAEFQAVVEPERSTVLIGAVVLEILDLLVDCNKQRLYPRDPERIISEVE